MTTQSFFSNDSSYSTPSSLDNIYYGIYTLPPSVIGKMIPRPDTPPPAGRLFAPKRSHNTRHNSIPPEHIKPINEVNMNRPSTPNTHSTVNIFSTRNTCN